MCMHGCLTAAATHTPERRASHVASKDAAPVRVFNGTQYTANLSPYGPFGPPHGQRKAQSAAKLCRATRRIDADEWNFYWASVHTIRQMFHPENGNARVPSSHPPRTHLCAHRTHAHRHITYARTRAARAPTRLMSEREGWALNA